MRPVDVRCYSGRRCSERQLSFTVEGMTYTVDRIENEWLESGKGYFRICTMATQCCPGQRR